MYAAFNTKTGEVLESPGTTYPRSTWSPFLTDFMINQLPGKEIHVIADNLPAHKSALLVKDFLEAHPKVHLHFASMYSSWLGHIDLWFGKIES